MCADELQTSSTMHDPALLCFGGRGGKEGCVGKSSENSRFVSSLGVAHDLGEGARLEVVVLIQVVRQGWRSTATRTGVQGLGSNDVGLQKRRRVHRPGFRLGLQAATALKGRNEGLGQRSCAASSFLFIMLCWQLQSA